MAHLGGQAALVHGADGVASADDGDGAILLGGLGHGLADAEGALGEVAHLEAAHGAVPDDGLGLGDEVGVFLDGLGADVQRHEVGGDFIIHGGDGGLVVELVGGQVVHGQDELHAVGLGVGQGRLGGLQELFLHQGLAHLVALGLQEGIGHSAADEDGVHLLHQVLEDLKFAGDLGAADDGHEGMDRILHGVAQEIDFLFQEEAGHAGAALGLHVLGDGGGGGVVAVGGAEGVVHVDIAVGGELFGHLLLLGLHLGLLGGIFLVAHLVGLLDLAFLRLVEAGVFQHEDLSGLEGGGLGVGVLAVIGELDIQVQVLGKIVADGLQAEIGLIALALRAAQVAHEDEGGTLLQHVLDGGLGGLDAGVVGDLVLRVEGDVEVHAHDDLLSLQFHVANRFLVHFGYLQSVVGLGWAQAHSLVSRGRLSGSGAGAFRGGAPFPCRREPPGRFAKRLLNIPCRGGYGGGGDLPGAGHFRGVQRRFRAWGSASPSREFGSRKEPSR